MSGSSRYRTLILGCEYSTFHIYFRSIVQNPQYDFCGFVHCFDGPPPIRFLKGTGPRSVFPVFALENLEKAIFDKHVQKCVILSQSIPMSIVSSLINRIISTGKCGVEFLPTKNLLMNPYKPLISITSLAPKTGKSQVGRYFCNVIHNENRKVAVILPMSEIIPGSDFFDIAQSPHFEFSSEDFDNESIPEDDVLLIQEYIKSGAYRVFYTADTRKAVILAEQIADLIICDARSCDIPYVQSKAKFCVVDSSVLYSVRSNALWPGLVNVNESDSIVVMSRGMNRINQDDKNKLQFLFKDSSLFFALSEYIIEGTSGAELFNRKVFVVDNSDTAGIGQQVAESKGAGEIADPGDVNIDGIKRQHLSTIVDLPKCSSTIPESAEKMNKIIDSLSKAIEKSDADVVVVTIGQHLRGMQVYKPVLYAMPEMNDVENKLYEWIIKFFSSNEPPLRHHFVGQANIINVFATISSNELNVKNNNSANKESFCRLFLQSHLPNGYRVTTGEIVDSFNNRTGQLDVIISNGSAPRLSLDMSGAIIAPVLADSVLGVIEVKTTLSADNLKKALMQLRPVKALMPVYTKIKSVNESDSKETDGYGKIVTGIFAFSPGSDMDNVERILSLFPDVADFVVLPTSTSFFSLNILEECGMGLPDEAVQKNARYAKFNSLGTGLSILFGVLNHIAANRRFSGVNYIRYVKGGWGSANDEMESIANTTLQQVHELNRFTSRLPEDDKRIFLKTRGKMIKILQNQKQNNEPNNYPV